MPIHDWTKVRANRFHDFHQSWIQVIRNALNAGILPDGYLAMAEQITGGPEPNVVTLSLPGSSRFDREGGLAVGEHPVKTTIQHVSESTAYAEKADVVRIYHPDGSVISVIEIVSLGNKDRSPALKQFTRKLVRYLRRGISLLVVDLYPPNKYQPNGIHPAIWDRIGDLPESYAPTKPLTLAAYHRDDRGAYWADVEPIAVGDAMPEMPIYLSPDRYVLCPLESTYGAAWELLPRPLREPLLAP